MYNQQEMIFYGYGLLSGLVICFIFWIISKRKEKERRKEEGK